MSSDSSENESSLITSIRRRLQGVANQIASQIVEDALGNGTGAPTETTIDLRQVAEAILQSNDVPNISGMTIQVREVTSRQRRRRRRKVRVPPRAPTNNDIKWKKWEDEKQCCVVCGEKGNVQLICYGNISLCHHQFCEDCIEQWFSSKAPVKGGDKVTLTCPTCRGHVCKTVNENGDIKRYRDYRLEPIESLMKKVIKAGGTQSTKEFNIGGRIPALEVDFEDHVCNDIACILSKVAADPDNSAYNETLGQLVEEMMSHWEGRVTNIYEIKQNAINYLAKKNKPWKKVTGMICNAKARTPTVDLSGYQGEVDTPQVVDIVTTPTANDVVLV